MLHEIMYETPPVPCVRVAIATATAEAEAYALATSSQPAVVRAVYLYFMVNIVNYEYYCWENKIV